LSLRVSLYDKEKEFSFSPRRGFVGILHWGIVGRNENENFLLHPFLSNTCPDTWISFVGSIIDQLKLSNDGLILKLEKT